MAIIEYQRLGNSYRNLFLTVLEAEKFKIKGPTFGKGLLVMSSLAEGGRASDRELQERGRVRGG